MTVTHYHRLIVPADANHHGTLYAGSLLRLALEAAYGTAWQHTGPEANLVLRRVLNLECLRPVPVGTVVDIQGAVLHRRRAYLAVGLIGAALPGADGPWLEALFGFAQVDEAGHAAELPGEPSALERPADADWQRLHDRLTKLTRIR